LCAGSCHNRRDPEPKFYLHGPTSPGCNDAYGYNDSGYNANYAYGYNDSGYNGGRGIAS
jgi:hypothetical protein